jgi:S1-C subfamily serine protease
LRSATSKSVRFGAASPHLFVRKILYVIARTGFTQLLLLQYNSTAACGVTAVRAYLSVVAGILIGSAVTALAQSNPAYSVKGVVLGTRVHFDSKAYEEYDCNPSEQFDGFTWCTKSKNEKEKRGPFMAYYSILHSRDGMIVYVNRFQEPAYWGENEVKSDIDYFSGKIGEQPTKILKMPSRAGFPNGTIALWGNVALEPVDAQSRKILAAGKSPKIGVMIDFLGNYERSAKNDLAVYRILGGPGFVWSASYNSDGRGTLRFLAINPSEFYAPIIQPSVVPPPTIAAPAPPPAQKPQVETVSWGTGFFVSAEGHIVTNAHVVAGCRNVTSSHGGRVTRIASDEASDLALLESSEKPRFWAPLRGGRGPRVAEAVMAIGFPLKGLLSSDPIVTTGIISALSGMRDDRRVIQITAPVQPGNSGGPLLGENGSVVGVVVSKLDALKMAEVIGDIPQNVNFAVSLGTLQSFLNTNGVPYVLDDGTATKTSADIAADASRYTVLLECVR